jgi:hypothetical protein
MARFVTRMGKMRDVHKLLVEKPRQKSPVGRFICKWADNIETDFKQIGVQMWTRFNWLETETNGGHLEQGNEPPSYITAYSFLMS